MFKRVLVANRGEIARRIIRTLTKMGIESVAVYSEADAEASYIKEATHSVFIGPSQASASYLCEESILKAASETECEALHPGFGFLAENTIFAARCLAHKLSFIGPSPSMIALMGDKAVARATMAKLGVPVLLGSDGVVANLKQAQDWAQRIGYPVLLKARSGGGGKGMRLVEQEVDMEKAFLEASREAQAAFGDGELYVEGFVKNARHIEFQVIGDAYGQVVVLGERECSIQRRNQKLLEEAPANGFNDSTRQAINQTIIKALTRIGYTNAGTLEFLLSSDGRLFFIEMNTRIQVEHPVTELTTDIDLVEWQLRVACNQRLPLAQRAIRTHGAAIECRINAEDAWADFKPNPGPISAISWPSSHANGPVRIETYIDGPYQVPAFYDSMLAKIICYGQNRSEAIKLMTKTLNQVSIQGIKTTLPFQRAIIKNAHFIAGSYDCSFIEKNMQSLLASSPES